MDQGPLVKEQIEAGAKFLDEFHKYAPVCAAFWIKKNEDSPWELYVASEHINEKNTKLTYGEVLRISGMMTDPNFNPFRVTLLPADDPMVKTALDLYKLYPIGRMIKYDGWYFGKMSIEGGLCTLPCTCSRQPPPRGPERGRGHVSAIPQYTSQLHTRSHALRGNAVFDAPRRLRGRGHSVAAGDGDGDGGWGPKPSGRATVRGTSGSDGPRLPLCHPHRLGPSLATHYRPNRRSRLSPRH